MQNKKEPQNATLQLKGLYEISILSTHDTKKNEAEAPFFFTR